MSSYNIKEEYSQTGNCDFNQHKYCGLYFLKDTSVILERLTNTYGSCNYSNNCIWWTDWFSIF